MQLGEAASIMQQIERLPDVLAELRREITDVCDALKLLRHEMIVTRNEAQQCVDPIVQVIDLARHAEWLATKQTYLGENNQ